jgi:hypothetical protein
MAGHSVLLVEQATPEITASAATTVSLAEREPRGMWREPWIARERAWLDVGIATFRGKATARRSTVRDAAPSR